MALLSRMVGFLNSAQVAQARAFYGNVLGFTLLSDDDFALVFDANGTTLRVNKAHEFTPAQGTVLGWEVDDVYAAINELSAKGVKFEQYNLPFIPQDAAGVWSPQDGVKVAWFKDPDGNVLSVTQHD